MNKEFEKLLKKSEQLDKIIDDGFAKKEEAIKKLWFGMDKTMCKELKERRKINNKIKKILLDCYKKHNP